MELMRAVDYSEEIISYPVYGQIKYNGIRAYWDREKGQLFSKTHKRLYVPKIEEYLMSRSLSLPPYLDGELIIPGIPFQEASGIIRRTLDLDKDNIQFIIFDIPSARTSYSERYKRLQKADIEGENIKIVENYTLDYPVEVAIFYTSAIQEGEEGIILRKYHDSSYVEGKSNTLIKKKPVYTEDLIPVGINLSSRGQFQGLVGSLTFLYNGKEFSAGSGLSLEERERLLSEMPEKVMIEWRSLSKARVPTQPTIKELIWKTK